MHFRRDLKCFLRTMQTNNHTESWHKTLKDADAFKLRGNIKYHIMLMRMASGTRDRNKQYRDEQNRTYILRTGTHYNDGIHYCGREARTLTRTIPVLHAMIANDRKAKSEDMINRCVEEVHDNEGTWAVSGSKEGSVHTVNLNTATCTCYSNRST